ncbi:hypothetical protein OFB58_25460, partial [Escherichia coli]|nr:hypothetical protein [Escherichia coli]
VTSILIRRQYILVLFGPVLGHRRSRLAIFCLWKDHHHRQPAIISRYLHVDFPSTYKFYYNTIFLALNSRHCETFRFGARDHDGIISLVVSALDYIEERYHDR